MLARSLVRSLLRGVAGRETTAIGPSPKAPPCRIREGSRLQTRWWPRPPRNRSRDVSVTDFMPPRRGPFHPDSHSPGAGGRARMRMELAFRFAARSPVPHVPEAETGLRALARQCHGGASCDGPSAWPRPDGRQRVTGASRSIHRRRPLRPRRPLRARLPKAGGH
jgi:hypothetical protein